MIFTCKLALLFVVGALFSIIGGVIYGVFPIIMEQKVKETVQLREGNQFYTMWSDLPIAASFRVYFFNVTNAEDVVQGQAKPHLQEVGPYVYKERRQKMNITWDDEDYAVSYRQKNTYYFQREESVGSDDDPIVIPNLPAISIMRIAEKSDLQTLLYLGLISGFLDTPSLYVTKKVSEILFDGYYDKFLDTAQKKAKLSLYPNGVFGLLIGQNGTDNGLFKVNTGVDDPNKFTGLISWNNETSLTFWNNGSHCNDINGTDGTQYAPYISKDDTLYIMVPELCRSAFIRFHSEVENEGILNYRFKTTADLFADPLINEDNACFCPTNDCRKTGILNIGSCKQGAPVAYSPPHFYQSEPALLDAVVGLRPDPNVHYIFVDIEPTTGVVMNAARRIQINIIMKPSSIKKIPEIFPMPDLVHPVLWIDEGGKIDKDNAELFKSMLYRPVRIVKGVTWTLIILGILMAVVAVALMLRKNGCFGGVGGQLMELK